MANINTRLSIKTLGVETKITQVFNPKALTKVTYNRVMKAFEDGFILSARGWGGGQGEIVRWLAEEYKCPRPMIFSKSTNYEYDFTNKKSSYQPCYVCYEYHPTPELTKAVEDLGQVLSVRMKIKYGGGAGIKVEHGWLKLFDPDGTAERGLYGEYLTPVITSQPGWAEGAARVREVMSKGEPVEVLQFR